MLIAIAIVTSLLAFFQNQLMFSFGLKEGGIFAAPFSFAGIFLVEVLLIWVGFFVVRHLENNKKSFLLGLWAILILLVAEAVLPVGYISRNLTHLKRQQTLDKVEVFDPSIEILKSEHGVGSRFALMYKLKFPKTDKYDIGYPPYIGKDDENTIYGKYVLKINPEYTAYGHYRFEAGKPYEVEAVFDTGAKKIGPQDDVNIKICQNPDYNLTCVVQKLAIEVEFKNAMAANPAPTSSEPFVPDDNTWDLVKKYLRLTDFNFAYEQIKTNAPIELTYSITNLSNKIINLPSKKLSRYIFVTYSLDPAHVNHRYYSDAISFLPERETIQPGEKILIKEKINSLQFAPIGGTLPAGKYKLHIKLFDSNPEDIVQGIPSEADIPLQEITEEFSIVQ